MFRKLAIVVAACLSSISLPVMAQTWSGGGANNNWSTGANWVGGVAPASNAVVTFSNPAAPLNSTVESARTLLQLELFNVPWNLSGQAITFGSPGFLTILGATPTISNALVFTGATQVNTNVAATLPNVSGAGSLTKTGAGALTITNFTATGAVTVSVGTLNASPTSGQNDLTVNATLNTVLGTWNGLSGNGTLNFTGGPLTVGSQGGGGTFSGTVAGDAPLQKVGAGTLVLTGSNSWATQTVIAGGTLQFGNGTPTTVPAVPVTNFGNLVLSSTVPITVPSVNGNGSATVTAGAVSTSGPWTLNNGSLTVSGGTLTNTSLTTDATASITFPATWNVQTGTVGALAGNGTVNVGSAMTIGNGAGISSTFSGNLTGPVQLVKNGNGALTLGPSGFIAVAGPVFVNGGALTLAGGAVSPQVQVFQGALAGFGQVNNAVTINPSGALNPTIGGNVLRAASFELYGPLAMRLDGTAPFTQYPRVHATSVFLIHDESQLLLSGDHVPTLGDTFMLVDNTGPNPIIGTFNGLPEGGVTSLNGVPMRISYVGGTGNDITLAVATQTVTPSAIGNGLVLPSDPQVVVQGDIVSFTLLPAAFHHLLSVTGTCPGGLEGNTFNAGPITADCTVIASFVPDFFTVTPTAGPNGTISPNTPQQVANGATTSFTVTPAAGYAASVASGCGGSLVGTTFTTGAVNGNCVVAATFVALANYNIVLEGYQQVGPYVATAASGSGTAIYNPVTRELSLNLTYSGLSSTETMAHIHGPAPRGANAGVLITLSGANPKVQTVILDSTQAAMLLVGGLYVNIHTAMYGNGELRGQIDLAGATLTRALTVAKSGSGNGAVNGTTEAGTVVNCGPDCSEAIPNGKVVTLTAMPEPGSTFAGWSGGGCSGTGNCVVTMSADTTVTAAFAQLNTYNIVLEGWQQVGPYVVTGATGSGTAVFNPVTKELALNLAYSGLSSSETMAHIHGPALRGANAGILVDLNGANPKVQTVTLSAAQETMLTAGQLYVNIHTATYGNGELRGQIDNAGATITRALSVTKAGEGTGTIAGTAEPGTVISCGADCVETVPNGKAVTLTATPADGSTFTGWSGDCTGTGQCVLTMNAARSATATFASVDPPRVSGISTRMQVLTGDDVMIGGFIIGGSAPKSVVVRARGPSLASQGVAGVLADTVLTLVPGAGPVVVNDDWATAANAADLAASGFQPSDTRESAIMATLDPGAYTAIVSGAAGATGVAIVEIYEMDDPEVPIIGISTRGRVQTADNVMIGGFIIQGDAPQTVVVRARGPSLQAQGVAGALMDPVLTLVPASGPATVNDDWQAAANAADLLASGFAPVDARESAILVTLNPGAYTAIVSGAGGTTGVAIVEVYKP